jgi:neutral ceramidase
MRRFHFAIVAALIALPFSGALAPADEPSPMTAGFAEADITPEIGMEQPGGYGKSYHRTLHDPCKVRAAVFADGRQRVALVGIDALVIRRAQVEAARKAIHEQCGIAPEAVLIAASHSHSSGPTGMILPGEYDHGSELVRELAYEKSSCADAGYLEHVVRQIVAAVVEADRRRVSAQGSIGSGSAEGIAFNRRFRMQNDWTYTHPGRGNPDIVQVAGPTDPEVGVIGAWDGDGNLLGCIVNFACHATTSPGGISANWIYYLEQTIRGAMGDDVVVVFLPGCAGDVTQVDNLSPYAAGTGKHYARLVGGTVGAEALKVLFRAQPGQLAPLNFKTTTLTCDRREPAPERVQQSLKLVEQPPQEVGATQWTFAKEIVLLDALLQNEPTKDVQVQVIQIGPAVFVTNPAEFFCQSGLDIKAGSPFPFTFPVMLANGCVGYVPTEEALGPGGGGYETRLTAYSNLEPSAATRIVRAGIALSKQLEPGAMPEPPAAPPFQAPWSYGNVPPELD